MLRCLYGTEKYLSKCLMSFSSKKKMGWFPPIYIWFPQTKVYKKLELFESCLNPQMASVLIVPHFSGEVVCWTIFLGSFLCFLSRDRSGGQGSFLSKKCSNQDSGWCNSQLSLHPLIQIKYCAQSPSSKLFLIQACNHFRLLYTNRVQKKATNLTFVLLLYCSCEAG